MVTKMLPVAYPDSKSKIASPKARDLKCIQEALAEIQYIYARRSVVRQGYAKLLINFIECTSETTENLRIII